MSLGVSATVALPSHIRWPPLTIVSTANEMLKEMIAELKSLLRDPSLPFGVDLLIPQVGGSARKTNGKYCDQQRVDIELRRLSSGLHQRQARRLG